MAGEKQSILRQDLRGSFVNEQRIDRKFERLARLVSESGVHRLGAAHVMVCGMGGVGSWAAEALVRSGIGEISLVDFDAVAWTNCNRQLPATSETIGLPKVEVMKARLLSINPQLKLHAISTQVGPDTLGDLLACRPAAVIDAIDQLRNKCHLLVRCKNEGIFIVSSAGAGGRLDPTQIRVSDLSLVKGDRLSFWTRTYLRKQHQFAPPGEYGIPVVHSLEPARKPLRLNFEGAEIDKRESRLLGIKYEAGQLRNLIMGTASFVTSSFGMAAASVVVRRISESTEPVG
jgi:tRNA A37 threonylcarbamoyladenosine dehydratase